MTFTLPSSCTAADGSGVAKGGNPENSNTGGYCVARVSDPDNPRIIVFTAG